MEDKTTALILCNSCIQLRDPGDFESELGYELEKCSDCRQKEYEQENKDLKREYMRDKGVL